MNVDLSSDSQKVELIPVLARYAPEVRRFAAFLAAKEEEEPAGAGVQPPSSDALDDYALWSDDDAAVLANAGTTTAGNYRLIMDAVIASGHVGDWVSIDQLSEWTGLARSTVKTFRTHLYRHIHAHFATRYSLAPFTAVNGNDLVPPRGRIVLYRVSEECADQWNRIQPKLTPLP